MTNPILEPTVCALCGKNDTIQQLATGDWLHRNPGTFIVVQCRHCGLVYQNPRPTSTTILDYYPPDYTYAPITKVDETRLTWRQKFSRDILIHKYGYPLPEPGLSYSLAPLVPLYRHFYETISLPSIPWRADGTLLDIGCGKGDYLYRMKQLGWQVQGIEPNPHAAQYAREQLQVPVIQDQLSNANLPTQSFDVITLWWVLEHLHQPLDVLRKARQLLKPAGVLWIGVPNWHSLEARLGREAWYHLDLPRHLYFFSPHTLRAMLHAAGLRLTQTHKLIWLNDPAQSIERWFQIKLKYQIHIPRLVSLPLAGLEWVATQANQGTLLVVAAQIEK